MKKLFCLSFSLLCAMQLLAQRGVNTPFVGTGAPTVSFSALSSNAIYNMIMTYGGGGVPGTNVTAGTNISVSAGIVSLQRDLTNLNNINFGGTITGNGAGITNAFGFNTNIASAGTISNSMPLLQFNGQIAASAGSKTAASISKIGAANTGFYFTGNGGFGYSAGGTAALYMDSASAGLELYPTWPISWGATAADSAADTYIRRASAGNVTITTNLTLAGSITTTNGYTEAAFREYSTNGTGNAAGSIFGLDLNLATATILQTNTMQFTNTLSVLPAGYTKTLNRTIIGSGNTFSVNPLWHGVGSYSTNGGTLVNGTHYKFSLEINYIVSSNAYYWAIAPCNN